MTDLLREDFEDYMGGGYDDEPLFADEDEAQPEVDTSLANRLLRRRTYDLVELANIKAIADEERRRLDAWQADRSSGLLADIAQLERLLEGFTRAVRDNAPGSVDLPNGVLRLTKSRSHVEISDVAGFLAWVHDSGADELVRQRDPEPDKRAILALPVYAGEPVYQGEPVRGVTIECAELPSFSIPTVKE
jgi:phage host-nuclease inhibitor protein Gam